MLIHSTCRDNEYAKHRLGKYRGCRCCNANDRSQSKRVRRALKRDLRQEIRRIEVVS